MGLVLLDPGCMAAGVELSEGGVGKMILDDLLIDDLCSSDELARLALGTKFLKWSSSLETCDSLLAKLTSRAASASSFLASSSPSLASFASLWSSSTLRSNEEPARRDLSSLLLDRWASMNALWSWMDALWSFGAGRLPNRALRSYTK